MAIVGHGVDLVETSRIREMATEHGTRFLDRVFTPDEQAYARLAGRREGERLAARFAAKEAVLKALGTGWRNGIAWTDIEVKPEPSGQPIVRLSGKAAEIARDLGIRRWHLSLTHTDTHAMASAIASG